MTEVGIGLIGSGFIGRVHALAYHAVQPVFGLDIAPRLEIIADADDERAAAAAAALGFSRSTGDWRSLVVDPAVDVVDITTPNHLHEEMAMAAIEAGKAIYCEKPLASTGEAAKRLANAAADAGSITMVGFNYLKNPIARLAKEIISSGEIGDITGYRGWHFEDYMHDAAATADSWRLDPVNGDGVCADLGSHAVSMARYLVGDIAEVMAQRMSVHRAATDVLTALLRFRSGATGTLEASWVAAGHKHTIAVEVFGTKGTVAFDFERLNELRLYRSEQDKGRAGFATILAGPESPGFGAFNPAPGHQLGFNDLKTIEVRDLLAGLAPESDGPWPDFREGWEVQRVLDAMVASDEAETWVAVASA